VLNVDTTNERVGIGTASPGETLEVNGTFSATGISLSNNDLGSANTIFGKNAGLSLDAGSNQNVFIGENVADAILDDALVNVGVGFQSLTALTSGNSNTAVGKNSFRDLTTGSYNTGMGYNVSQTLTTGFYSTYIGANVTPSAVDVDDETVIGANAIGQGANTVVLGDDNVTDIYLSEDGGATVHAAIVTGDGTNPLELGTAAATGHSLGSGDVLVGGKLEVDGDLYLDSLVYGGMQLNGTDSYLALRYTGVNYLTAQIYVDDGTHFALDGTDGSNNNHLIVTTTANLLKNHDHNPASTNPTIFIHSAADPDTNNTQWLSLAHDQTDGVITTGTGNLNLVPAGGTVAVTGTITATVACCADYVFGESYDLPTIEEVEAYVTEVGHLPGMTQGVGTEQKPLDMGQAITELIVKVEEQSRYIMQLHKRINELEK